MLIKTITTTISVNYDQNKDCQYNVVARIVKSGQDAPKVDISLNINPGSVVYDKIVNDMDRFEKFIAAQEELQQSVLLVLASEPYSSQ
jgi:hypothetical protein